jgi:hypothetical protein
MRDLAAMNWIARRTGRRPIIVVAPHGGRRTRALRRGDGINDLYTAEIATGLAERLDAYAIVNRALDRNEIDLNRISELVDRAPALLSMLRETVDLARAESGAVPLVLLVHGWNVSSLHCDIGIGLRERGGGLVGTYPTIAAATVDTFVKPLRFELARRGLCGLVGHRYAASGADNTTQLFSGRHREHEHAEVAALSRMAFEGRAEAVQLELSIVLRWPGPYRERLLDALVAAVETHASGARSRTRVALAATGESRGWAQRAPRRPGAAVGDATRAAATGDRRFAGESMQAVLSDGGGLFMAVEPAERHALTARVCIALPDGRLALFVCEAPRSSDEIDRLEAGGLRWQIGGPVCFRGPAVLYPTHDAFLDLERGLGGATIADVEVAIAQVGEAETHGSAAGYVRIDDRLVEIFGRVVRHAGGRLGGGAPPVARLYLTDESAVAPLVIEQRGAAEAGEAAVECDGRSVVARHPTFGELSGQVTVRVPVYRPAGDGRYLAILFGVVELRSTTSHKTRRALFETVALLPLSP